MFKEIDGRFDFGGSKDFLFKRTARSELHRICAVAGGLSRGCVDLITVVCCHGHCCGVG